MVKKLGTLFMLLVLLSSFALAQETMQRVKKVDLSKEPPATSLSVNKTQSVFKYFNPSVGDTIGVSYYDAFTNSVLRHQVVISNGLPYFFNMIRPWGGNELRRSVIFCYNDGGTYKQIPPFPTTANTGWPDIDAQLTGSAVGTIGVTSHTPNRLGIWDSTSQSFSVSQFEPNTDPSIHFMGDNIFLATSGNRLVFDFWKTTDYGTSFTQFKKITDFVPPLIFKANGGVEVGMCKSINEQHMAYFGTIDDSALYYEGHQADSCNETYLLMSSDAGNTFTAKCINFDGVPGTIQNYPLNVAPLIQNFGQVSAVVSNSGVYHVAANGYSALFNTAGDTLEGFVHPIIYWNSTTNKWKAISNFAVDTIAIVTGIYPGNLFGQAYPSLAMSPDGKVLFCSWSIPQTTNNKLDTLNGKYWMDYAYTWSTDGGTTWDPVTVGGKNNRSEWFIHPAEFLTGVTTGTTTTYTAHTVYMEHISPLSFINDNGPSNLNPIIYKTFTKTVTTGVEDNKNVVNSFSLEQNYPNPFNPSTSIKFTLAEQGNVSLVVYDMLGREVATLLNGVQTAGDHQVTFNASKLASGMYVYTIKAGNFTASKKMLLMK